MNSKIIATIAIIAILIVAGIAYYEIYKPFTKPTTVTTTTTTTTSTTTSATVAFPVALTDPPSVPAGTSELLLNYTAVELITNSSPLFENYSGSVNLLQLVNTSKVIAMFNISKTVAVNQIRLFVSSATIVINGTKYPVFLPSGVLKIPITNATSGALVDLQPHIVTAYAGQQPEYILTPVATAIPFSTTAKVGQTVQLPSQTINKLHRVFANVTIVSASISFKGNTTSISVTVKNNADEPVVIYSVRIFGDWETYISAGLNKSAISIPPQAQTFLQNAPMGFNGSFTHYMPIIFFVYNNSLQPFPSAPINPQGLHFFMPKGFKGPFNFNFTSQFNVSEIENFTPPIWHGEFGIVLKPGQTVTLNYTGVITPLWHMHFRSHMLENLEMYTVPINGYQYQIKLMSVPPSNSTYIATAKEI